MFGAKEEILFEWKCPKEIARQKGRKEFKIVAKMAPRAFILITLLLILLYFVFDYLFPPAINFNLFNTFLKVWLFGIGLMIYGFLAYPWLLIFDQPRYSITDKLIKIKSVQHLKVLKWQDLQGYVLSESDIVKDYKNITFITNDRPTLLYLPNNSFAEQIIGFIAQRLQAFNNIPIATNPKLTYWQKTIFVSCTVLYSIIISYCIIYKAAYFIPEKRNEFVDLTYLMAVLLLGPGTICSLIIFDLSVLKEKWYKLTALFFNSFGFVLIMLFSVILFLWKVRSEVGGW